VNNRNFALPDVVVCRILYISVASDKETSCRVWLTLQSGARFQDLAPAQSVEHTKGTLELFDRLQDRLGRCPQFAKPTIANALRYQDVLPPKLAGITGEGESVVR
jgi:hypothetical protein